MKRLMPIFQSHRGKISMDELRHLKWDLHRCVWAGGRASRRREEELTGGGKAAMEDPTGMH